MTGQIIDENSCCGMARVELFRIVVAAPHNCDESFATKANTAAGNQSVFRRDKALDG